MILRDRFGRDLKVRGVTLVDWEGHMANPAVRLTIELSDRVNLPARVVLHADGCRLMFDLFSEVGPEGPSKTLLFQMSQRRADFLMSVFPDRAGGDENYVLTAELTTGVGERRSATWPVRVLDQDRDRPVLHPVHVDYRYDETGFFADARARRILESAVRDWAYFLEAQGFDPVPAGDEKAFVHDATTFARGRVVTNAEPYVGFLLFAQGIRGPERRSGGRASDTGGLQTRAGRPTGLRRSGTVISEVTGNWNGLGWSMEESDDRWWVSSCHAREPHDYYSVVRHEIGHSILYHRVIPGFARLWRRDRIRDRSVERYLGRAPRINPSEHLYETVDPVSRVGAFGNEYGGDMPRKRWLITKLDLLMLRAAGYRLRETSAMTPLRLTTAAHVTLPRAGSGRVGASGGVPDYDFRIIRGALPTGLSMDPFTGEISGVAEKPGRYRITVEVRDNDPTAAAARANVVVVVQ